MRAGHLVPLLLAVAACGDTAPIGAVPLSITAAVSEVPLGKAFPIEVVRTWSRGTAPEWSDETLAPLHVRLVETSRREEGGRVEETRRYEAYAFSLANLTEPIELRVTRALDPTAPGPAELPKAPGSRSSPWWILGTALGALALFLYVRRRRQPQPAQEAAVAPETAPPDAHIRALARLDHLRAQQPDGHDQLQLYYREATELLRDYVGERFALMTAVLTSEELLRRSARSDTLADVLGHCDLVKFARHAATAPERERMLDGAEGFIRETQA